MAACGATTWRYSKAWQSVRLTVSAVAQGYQLLLVGPVRCERLTFQTVDAVMVAQSECERTLFERGFLLVEFTSERGNVTAHTGYSLGDQPHSRAKASVH